MLRIGAMSASRQEVYYIAIRMQTGAIRRDLRLIGLGERAGQHVLDALDRVDARVREWGVTGLVAAEQLQRLLARLMALPGELRTLKEAGPDEELTLDLLEEADGSGPVPEDDGSGMVN
jgi:hypothetical protein